MSRLSRAAQERVILMVMIRYRSLALVVLMETANVIAGPVGHVQLLDGTRIASDPDFFSEAVRLEFADLNERFAELGFELEVFQRPPALNEIIAKYGNPERTEELKIPLGVGTDELPVSVVFSYYGEIGFGVRTGDLEQIVVRIKRRED